MRTTHVTAQQVLCLFALTSACASSSTPRSSKSPADIVTKPVVVRPFDDEATPLAKFERARSNYDSRAFEAAALLFEDVSRDARAPHLRPLALFNAGVSWDMAGNHATALLRFRETSENYVDTEQGKLASLRAARLLGYLERWKELADSADRLLARADLSDVEKLEAVGCKALALAELGEVEAAEKFVSRGRDLSDSLGLGRGGKLPLEAAQVQFALGETRRLRSERIRFSPVPPNFLEVLEQRCQGLLDAQSAYAEAMRSYDPHWAAMSGYRVGELYERLYRDLMSIPPPQGADDDSSVILFRAAMRLRYRVLLEKGLAMIDHTLALAERTGHTSGWIDRAREAKAQLEAAISEQRDSLSKLPYSEEDLERALRDLASKKKAQPRGGS